MQPGQAGEEGEEGSDEEVEGDGDEEVDEEDGEAEEQPATKKPKSVVSDLTKQSLPSSFICRCRKNSQSRRRRNNRWIMKLVTILGNSLTLKRLVV